MTAEEETAAESTAETTEATEQSPTDQPKPRTGRRISVIAPAGVAIKAPSTARFEGKIEIPEEVRNRMERRRSTVTGNMPTWAERADADEESQADFLALVDPGSVTFGPEEDLATEAAAPATAVDAGPPSQPVESRWKEMWRGATAAIIAELRGEKVTEHDVEKAAFAANVKHATARHIRSKLSTADVVNMAMLGPDFDQPLRGHKYAASFGKQKREYSTHVTSACSVGSYQSNYSSLRGSGGSMGHAKRETGDEKAVCAVSSYEGAYSSFGSKGVSGMGNAERKLANDKEAVCAVGSYQKSYSSLQTKGVAGWGKSVKTDPKSFLKRGSGKKGGSTDRVAPHPRTAQGAAGEATPKKAPGKRGSIFGLLLPRRASLQENPTPEDALAVAAPRKQSKRGSMFGSLFGLGGGAAPLRAAPAPDTPRTTAAEDSADDASSAAPTPREGQPAVVLEDPANE